MVTVHNPEQRWWRDVALRKQDAIDYYEAIAPVLLPHLRDRSVATPIRWDELDAHLEPAAFTPGAVLGRVRDLGDLFAAPVGGQRLVLKVR